MRIVSGPPTGVAGALWSGSVTSRAIAVLPSISQRYYNPLVMLWQIGLLDQANIDYILLLKRNHRFVRYDRLQAKEYD